MGPETAERDREPPRDDLAHHDGRVGRLAERDRAVARKHAIAIRAAPCVGMTLRPSVGQNQPIVSSKSDERQAL